MSATSTHSGAAHFDRLVLEAGVLAPLTVAYETYGRLNDAGTNAVLVCHALTGSAHAGALLDDHGSPSGAEGWWEPLIGPGRG